MVATRINGAIARLANDQPVFYTGSHTGAELTFEAGRAMADTWADYINIGMEHGPLDIPGLNRFMQGMASVPTPTPVCRRRVLRHPAARAGCASTAVGVST